MGLPISAPLDCTGYPGLSQRQDFGHPQPYMALLDIGCGLGYLRLPLKPLPLLDSKPIMKRGAGGRSLQRWGPPSSNATMFISILGLSCRDRKSTRSEEHT